MNSISYILLSSIVFRSIIRNTRNIPVHGKREARNKVIVDRIARRSRSKRVDLEDVPWVSISIVLSWHDATMTNFH